MKDTKLEIKGVVVEQSLQLLRADKVSHMHQVAFGPAYYGTDRIEEAYLYNNGPEPVKWVTVLEEGVDGEEAVSTIPQCNKTRDLKPRDRELISG